jgi:hypothetical protein
MFNYHRATPLLTIRRVTLNLTVFLLLITPRITSGQIITLSFTPTAALDANGHLEAFALGSDGALWRIVQNPNGTWGAWQGIGGLSLGGPPVAAVNANGQLEIFVRGTNGALWHIPQVGSVFSGWSSLGGALGSVPAVGRNSDGRLEVFALGTNDALNHIWQLAANGSTGWASWASLGGTGKSIPTVGLNTVGTLAGSLQVFVVGNDFPVPHLYTLWQTSSGWSRWTSLGGSISPQPSVASNKNGSLEVFAIGNDVFSGQNVTHNWQAPPGGTSWVGFSSLGKPSPGVISPTAGSNKDSRLEIFGISGDKALWHNWQVTPMGGWAGWASLGVPGTGTNWSIALAQNADGRLAVFAISAADGLLWEIHQTVPNGGWSAWASLGQPGAPSAGGGNIALLTFLGLLALWIAFRVRDSKRIVSK